MRGGGEAVEIGRGNGGIRQRQRRKYLVRRYAEGSPLVVLWRNGEVEIERPCRSMGALRHPVRDRCVGAGTVPLIRTAAPYLGTLAARTRGVRTSSPASGGEYNLRRETLKGLVDEKSVSTTSGSHDCAML
jgi:hypothetical protein